MFPLEKEGSIKIDLYTWQYLPQKYCNEPKSIHLSLKIDERDMRNICAK